MPFAGRRGRLLGHREFVPRVVTKDGRSLNGAGIEIDEPGPDARVTGCQVNDPPGERAVIGMGLAAADPPSSAVSPQPEVRAAWVDHRRVIREFGDADRQRIGDEPGAIEIDERVHANEQWQAVGSESETPELAASMGRHGPVRRRGVVDRGHRSRYRHPLDAEEPHSAVRCDADAAKAAKLVTQRGRDRLRERVEPTTVEPHDSGATDTPNGIVARHGHAHERHGVEAVLDRPPADGVGA